MAERIRVTVVLDERTDETLRRAAAVQNVGVSTLIRQLLQDFEPMLRSVAELGEAFERATVEQRHQIAAAIEQTDKDVKQPLADLLERVRGGFAQPTLELVPGPEVDPRPVITGVNRRSKRSGKGK